MSEIVEPPSNIVAKTWRRVPESWRLPLVFIIPAVLVVALMPLLFMDGGGLLGIMRREFGGILGDGSKSARVFESKTQKAEPLMAMPPAEAAPIVAPASSLTRPTDGLLAFGGAGPGETASASSGAGEGGEKEGLEAGGSADVDGSGGMAGAGSGGAAGKAGGMPRLAVRQSQFSYQGSIGSGNSSAPRFRGFDFGKAKGGSRGGAVGAGPGSTAGPAEGAIGMASGAADTAETNKIASKKAGSASGTGAGSGDAPTVPQGSGFFTDASGSGGPTTMGTMDTKRCEEAQRKYQGPMNQAGAEYGALTKRRYNEMNCRDIGCSYGGYDCEAYARRYARIWYRWLMYRCTCGQIACRAINACRRLADLTCKMNQECNLGCRDTQCR